MVFNGVSSLIQLILERKKAAGAFQFAVAAFELIFETIGNDHRRIAVAVFELWLECRHLAEQQETKILGNVLTLILPECSCSNQPASEAADNHFCTGIKERVRCDSAWESRRKILAGGLLFRGGRRLDGFVPY